MTGNSLPIQQLAPFCVSLILKHKLPNGELTMPPPTQNSHSMILFPFAEVPHNKTNYFYIFNVIRFSQLTEVIFNPLMTVLQNLTQLPTHNGNNSTSLHQHHHSSQSHHHLSMDSWTCFSLPLSLPPIYSPDISQHDFC